MNNKMKKALIFFAALLPLALSVYLASRLIPPERAASFVEDASRALVARLKEASSEPAAKTPEQPSSGMQETYSTLVKVLGKEMKAQEVHIQQSPEKIEINLVEKLLFHTASAEITPEGKELLLKVGSALARIDGKRIYVVGHTDNVPISTLYPSNWELSTARACSVIRFLTDKDKIAPNLFYALGRADQQPVADNATEEGRAQNRRVEILIANIPDLESIAAGQGANPSPPPAATEQPAQTPVPSPAMSPTPAPVPEQAPPAAPEAK
ncbi:MAG: OmpA family protein [Desulfovibrionaceae bacterium]|nr:OmpA family protein [Desulfovibrionaceae bacterium]MBF0512988.1 OmpA family protein [Desulfovibrionaceae bacterium]